ncbi:YoaP domain-containing protein [bacterium]|nr:YoaP domain-containing protein [bacterium]
MDALKMIQVTPENYQTFAFCGYKNPKRPGYQEKTGWVLEQLKHGLRVFMLHSEKTGTQGMIEYMPGKTCWRSIRADKYMVIHCLFVGFKKEFKGHGYASKLIEQCEADAKKQKLAGVAVVVRKGSFMADERIFLKRKYAVVDRSEPDFLLMAKTFSTQTRTPPPCFAVQLKTIPEKWKKGLILFRADQCPYTVTNVQEMAEVAKNEFKLTLKIVDLNDSRAAQQSPVPFGTFGILYQGDILAYHPISATRFRNILKALKD